MTGNAISDADPIILSLQALAQDSPYLKEAVQFYGAILPLLRDADIHVGTVFLTPEQACSKMEMGLPLLHELDIEFDDQSVQELMFQLACAVEKFAEGRQKSNDSLLRAAAVRRVREALENNKLNISEILQGIVAGDRTPVISFSEGLQLDAGLVWMLAQHSLKPALQVLCRQLTPLAEAVPWHNSYCFICGADAILSELQGNAQVKHLRCGQCGADWLFRRLQCMHCGNEDHTTLGYLYSENQREKFRVEVCEKCKGYLKVITTFTPASPEKLPVEDIATLHLDYIAQEKGYTRVPEIKNKNTTLLFCGIQNQVTGGDK